MDAERIYRQKINAFEPGFLGHTVHFDHQKDKSTEIKQIPALFLFCSITLGQPPIFDRKKIAKMATSVSGWGTIELIIMPGTGN